MAPCSRQGPYWDTLRRPGDGKHRPGPTVDRSKPGHTGLLSRESNRGPGQHTIILTALAVLRRAVPADAAGLRRVRRVHLLDPPRRLVLQPGHHGAPAVRQDAPVESGLGTAPVKGRILTQHTGLPPRDNGSGKPVGKPPVRKAR